MITPEMVVAAYKKLGAKLGRRSFGSPQHCCGLAALGFSLGLSIDEIVPWANKTYGDYWGGFVRGFDGLSDGKTGYKDGMVAYQACVEAGL